MICWRRSEDGGYRPDAPLGPEDEPWRGDVHLAEPPVESYGPEYWMWRKKLDEEEGGTWPARC